MNDSDLILVDDHDNIVGFNNKLLVHQKGLLHRAFSVMLYRFNHQNKKLEFLLQQRAYGKYHCGGLWANTCCSHPLMTEEVIVSAKNRLKAELVDINLDNINLINIGNFIYRAEFANGLIEHEFDHVFIGEYNDFPVFFNQDEIHQLEWCEVEQIKNSYHIDPEQYSPWFYQVYCMSLDKINFSLNL